MQNSGLSEKAQQVKTAAERTKVGSRFRPPRMLFNGIERPYLLSKLLDGLARQIVILRAPPGFGKTALMKAAYDRISAGTLRLPGGCETPIAHCAWLTLSLPQSPEDFVADLRQALDLPRGEETGNALMETMEAVGLRSGVTILFIDNVDDVGGQNRSLEEMVLSAPDNLRIALASLRPAPIPIARLKAAGTLSEISAGDMLFGRSELQRLSARSQTTASIDHLMEVTRGWPALTQLATLPSQGEQGTPLAGQNADMVGFVRETISSQLSPNLCNLLRKMAVFDEFRLDLAADLGAEQLLPDDLAMIETLNPVIEKNAGGWLTLHPVLRSCLAEDTPGAPANNGRTLHRQAAIWFATQGFLEQAVSHAARSGDFRMAEEIIDQAGGVDIFLRAGHKVLEHLIDNFPPEVLHASPGLAVCYAVVLSKRGNATAGRERLDLLKEKDDWSPVALAAVNRNVLDHIDSLIDVYVDRRMNVAQAQRLEQVAAGLPPHATWELAWIHNHLCIVYTRLGDIEAARRTALKALGYYREEKATYAQVFMLVHLGLVGSLAGEFSSALQFCREAEALVESKHWSDRNLLAITRLACADVLYHQGEVQLVEAMLNECMEPLVRGESWVDLYTRLFSLLSRSRLHITGFDSAVAAIDKAEEVAVERAMPRLKVAAGIMRIDLLVRVGMIESAGQAGEKVVAMRAKADPNNWTWREDYDYEIASSRLAIVLGHSQIALDAVETLIRKSSIQGQGYHRLIAEIIAVRAAWKAGQQDKALSYLQSAIALARAHQATQFFIDEGSDFAVILRAIVRRFGLKAFSVDAVEFMSRIVGRDFQRPPKSVTVVQERKDRIPPSAGLLSNRETGVLKLLVDGRSNKEMARALDISEATVKFHLKNIYTKLGVSRRGMAVSLSNQLNLTTQQ
ncbi:LuxR family maltose regulon positive regulatory protein [Rhizobium skierniewicense]|uniref:LuxR family maltose regulon positive regulatory protein n=1 Tax=Rhizobium skierniewicense TaxID=984260 RepID=A0A7W6G0D7_9HYPH|nr:LuxR C-terminal-related transcriptional regulator [Rhizobium skierniewicense]MBB3944587.1 LuxR family maltose regulon positive regulatory protein [Rhizobium skierniewicense]